MARSVVELLPRPFAELTLADVEQIVTPAPGEPRETLWLERKQAVNTQSLSKACAAFANTYGGLLVVGVADGDDRLVGIEPRPEPELWVKDVLRGNVLPMPPFRARWLPNADGDRGVLLVLVEESSTTPHLILSSGAIYVRNPGSSDPVPIDDQRRLLDLTARGERAVERARSSARETASDPLPPDPNDYDDHWEATETLALAPTGIAADFEARIFDPVTPSPPTISSMVWGEQVYNRARDEWRYPEWAQHYVAVRRQYAEIPSFNRERVREVVTVSRDGTFRLARGYTTDAPDRQAHLQDDEQIRPWLTEALRAGRDVLLEFGAHGDVELAYRLDLRTRGIWFRSVPESGGAFTPGRVLGVQFGTTLNPDDGAAVERILAELLRAVGHGPRNL